MVTATDKPDVLRVSFFEEETDKNRYEVVCLVEATNHGELKITYQHHAMQSRPTGSGSWEPEQILRHGKMTPALSAAIRSHVMYELFSTFIGENAIKLSGITGSSLIGMI